MNEHPSHPHDFGQSGIHPAAGRTFRITVLTAVTMIAEIIAGLWSGSMALLADGIHMGTHASALGLTALSFHWMNRYAHDRRFSLGSGKINELTAYTSSLFLLLTTLWLMMLSIHRLIAPQTLHAEEALTVACLGLAVNVVSMMILRDTGEHRGHRHDANLRAAWLHILADALTSLAAIAGIIAAGLWGWWFLDPLIALCSALLILRWSWSLLRQTVSVLLDREALRPMRRDIETRLRTVSGTEITDLHIWSVGRDRWTMMAAVRHASAVPDDYKNVLRDIESLHHPLIEINRPR